MGDNDKYQNSKIDASHLDAYIIDEIKNKMV